MTPAIHLSRTRFLALLAAAAASAALAGCAAFAPKSPEDLVRERAQARWQALLAGDYERAYQFLSPGSRSVVSLDRFRGRHGNTVTWKSAEVFKVECGQPERCVATITIVYQPLLARGSSIGSSQTSVDEVWILDSGQWWLPFRL